MFLLRIWRTSVMTTHQAQLCSCVRCVRMNQLWLPFFCWDFMGFNDWFTGFFLWGFLLGNTHVLMGIMDDQLLIFTSLNTVVFPLRFLRRNPLVFQCLGFTSPGRPWSLISALVLSIGRYNLEMYKQHNLRIVAKQQWIVCGSNLSQKYESPAPLSISFKQMRIFVNRFLKPFPTESILVSWHPQAGARSTHGQLRFKQKNDQSPDAIANDVSLQCVAPGPSYKLI